MRERGASDPLATRAPTAHTPDGAGRGAPDRSGRKPLLELREIDAHHGLQRALSGVSFGVEEGSVTAVLGGNGAGKSTLLDTIMGVLRGQPSRGALTFAGARIDGLAPERIVRAGISYVPEGRRLFAGLTVRENLAVGAYVRRDRSDARRALERVYDHFPLLAERSGQTAGTLSGGEQQMLAIGRALMNGPRLMLLDEPSLGLAPVLVHRLYEIVARLRDEGLTILLAEPNVRAALHFADSALVLDAGVVVASGPPGALAHGGDVARLLR